VNGSLKMLDKCLSSKMNPEVLNIKALQRMQLPKPLRLYPQSGLRLILIQSSKLQHVQAVKHIAHICFFVIAWMSASDEIEARALKA
jgi:hypothetical protein